MVPRPAGGIRQLCELIDEYGEELTADLQQIYGLRLADVFRGALAPRDVLVLAGQLGTVPESRVRAATLGGPGFAGWSRVADILADIHDSIVDNSVVTIKSAGGKANAAEPYPRPSLAADEPEVVDVPTIDDFPIHLVVAMTRKK